MPTPPLERRRAEILLPGYAKLLKEVRETLLLGQERIEREKVLTYWKTGKLINQYIQANGGRAEYGQQVVARLSRDLKIGEKVLYRTMRFAESFPIFSGRRKLVWSHYRALIAVPDQKTRLELADKADRFGWTSTQLEERIKTELGKARPAPEAPPFKQSAASFKPKRGTVGACRVVFSEGLLIDLGFSTFIEHPDLQSGRFKEGDIVQVSPSLRGGRKADEAISLLRDATAACLYTYTAEVEKVADGDTLWLWISLGFNLWVRQRVRLRGIDAPELDTEAGRAAKRFVEETLLQAPGAAAQEKSRCSAHGMGRFLIVTTTKPDKFDRYLADIWLGGTNLNQLLLSSGHARLKSDYSDRDWDLANWGRF